MFTETEAFSSFAVDDLEAARSFYGETLGIRVSEVVPELVIALETAGGRTTMVYLKPDFVAATYTVLNFPVADLEAAVGGLAERGVELERYESMEQDERGISRGEGPPIAWFKDPAGNVLAVIEQTA